MVWAVHEVVAPYFFPLLFRGLPSIKMDAAVSRTNDNFGPLTTAWSKPASCRGDVVFLHYAACTLAGNCTASYGATCSNIVNDIFWPDDNTECWPPRSTPFTQRGFYSPGLECPGGYYSACSATFGGSRNGWNYGFPLTSGETAVGCCPRSASSKIFLYYTGLHALNLPRRVV